MVLPQKKYTFLRFKKGSNIIQGRGPTFSRGGGGGGGEGLNANFYRNPYNLWFLGGGGGGPDTLSPSGSAHEIFFIPT